MKLTFRFRNFTFEDFEWHVRVRATRVLVKGSYTTD